MIPLRNDNRVDIRNAYGNMILQEANESQHKKLNSAVDTFIKKNKPAFKDYKGAVKIASVIKAHEWNLEIIGLIADLSNTMKDSSEFEDELNKIIDMV